MKIRTISHAAATFAALFALGGCGSNPPKPHQFESTRTYNDVSFDQGWENVVGFFANNRIPIKNIEKDSGVIYAEATWFPPAMADCGEDWEEDDDWVALPKVGKFNVFFRRGDPLTVTVNADFLTFDEEDTWRCESTGVVEGMVLDAVEGNVLPQDAGGE